MEEWYIFSNSFTNYKKGKTCLLWVYANDEFPEEYVPTIFTNTGKMIVSLKAKTFIVIANVIVNDKTIHLSLWDTAYVFFTYINVVVDKKIMIPFDHFHTQEQMYSFYVFLL